MDIQQIISTLQPDMLTLIVGTVLLVLAIVTPLFSPFFKAVKPEEEDDSGDSLIDAEDDNNESDLDNTESGSSIREDAQEQISNCPPVSILLTPHDNAEQLMRNLEAYLSQDYPAGFEVIVVTWKGDHDTDNALKRYASDKRLYMTYIPDSSRYMPREKLAVTIGVKAAKNEWMMLADIACKPESDQWLTTMARNCDKDANLVLGHTRYEEDTPAFRRYERFYKGLYLKRETLRGQAYRGDGGCLMFRRSEFMAAEGYRGNLKFLRGEYDFVVNKYARPGSVRLEMAHHSWLTEDEPTLKHWRNSHLFYMENRQHLARSAAHRFPYNLHQTVLHANFILELVVIIFACVTMRWLLLAMACVSLILTFILRTVFAQKVLKAWDEHIPAGLTAIYEMRLLWFDWGNKRRYRKANKNDFISHKL